MVNSRIKKVGVLRLSGHVIDLPPGYTWPEQQRRDTIAAYKQISGGRESDNRQLAQLDKNEVLAAFNSLVRQGAEVIVIIAVFAPSYPDDELTVRNIIRSVSVAHQIILSHQVGGLGFIARENATILKASAAAI
jgi:N-methylhydantoinase A/oxoprolinase/acetone carboxylase beta subunit